MAQGTKITSLPNEIKKETEVPGEGTTNIIVVVVVVLDVDLQAISIKVANLDAAARGHSPFAIALLRHHRSSYNPALSVEFHSSNVKMALLLGNDKKFCLRKLDHSFRISSTDAKTLDHSCSRLPTQPTARAP